MTPQVKICGVCRPGDAALAVDAGASHVGVIRVPGSRRTRSKEEARAVVDAAAGARTVGVFVDADVAAIVAEVEELGLDVVQLHGGEPPERVTELAAQGLEVWKVLKPERGEELIREAERFAGADLILVEGRSDRGHGGVGARFPWAELETAVGRVQQEAPVGVGGGLTPDNVGGVVRRFHPRLVDVSSGVEAELCRKDPDRVRAFVQAAHEAGRE